MPVKVKNVTIKTIRNSISILFMRTFRIWFTQLLSTKMLTLAYYADLNGDLSTLSVVLSDIMVSVPVKLVFSKLC